MDWWTRKHGSHNSSSHAVTGNVVSQKAPKRVSSLQKDMTVQAIHSHVGRGFNSHHLHHYGDRRLLVRHRSVNPRKAVRSRSITPYMPPNLRQRRVALVMRIAGRKSLRRLHNAAIAQWWSNGIVNQRLRVRLSLAAPFC